MSSDRRAGPRLPLATATRHTRRALALAWRAAPMHTTLDLILAVTVGAAPVVTAWLTKEVVDRLISGAGGLLAVGAGLAVAAAATALLPQARKYVEAERGRSVTRLVRTRLYQAVIRFTGLRRLEDPDFQDRLQLAQQTGHLGPGQLTGSGLAALQGVIGLLGFLAVLQSLAPWMTAVVLLAALPTLWLQLRLNRQRAAMMLRLERFERRDLFFSQLLVGIPAAKEVRLFGLGALFGDRMLAEVRAMHDEERWIDRRELRAQVLLGLLGAAVAGSGLVYAVLAARSGRLTIGDVTLFLAAVPGVQAALAGIVGQIGTIHQALLLFDHYDAVVQSGPDLPVPVAARPAPPLRLGIELRDVWFRYSPQHPWVLQGVNLHLPGGMTTALVGLNGAGKSTIVKLLCRFYDPDRGAILWDGVDLRELDPASLRRRIGAVFQDFMAYDLTAAENIALGDLSALSDRPRLAMAAEQAGVADTLRALPRGYDTLLTRIFYDNADRDDPQTGVVLSGGQWQRVALARSFLRADADLLILDEPSSGLDAQAEHDIHTRLRRLRAGRTSLLISHRLGTVREADRIVVLDQGRVVEQGDHAALIAADGEYARLFRLQSHGYRDQSPAAAR